mgnify:CR=1 FL=1
MLMSKYLKFRKVATPDTNSHSIYVNLDKMVTATPNNGGAGNSHVNFYYGQGLDFKLTLVFEPAFDTNLKGIMNYITPIITDLLAVGNNKVYSTVGDENGIIRFKVGSTEIETTLTDVIRAT